MDLKFRAWNIRIKEMEYINDLYWFEENGVHENGDNDYQLMQYTGLKDKNGKEIYEGDILSSKQWCCKCEVIWEGGGFTLKQGDTSYNLHENFTDDDGNYLTDVEVAGNIYENKEMMEGFKWD